MGRWADIVGLLNPLKIISGDNALYLGTGNRPSSYGFPNSVYLVMDKTSSADDATIVYRTNGNARAEAGIAEDDDYHVKTVTGTYPNESFVDRLIVRASGLVDAVNSILRVNSATGTPTLIVGNSDGATAGAGVEVIYDQVNKQGAINCIERGNTYRGMIVNCNGITYNFGSTTVANVGSFNQFGMTLGVPLSVTTTSLGASVTITDTGGNGANLKFVGNGATTPNKYIRAQGGRLEFANNAYNTVVTAMDDSGNWKVHGLTPSADNSYSNGAAALRWSVVYAGTGTINTSDARDKTPVAPLSDAELAAAKALAAEIGTYQFLDAVAAKGASGARQHVGLTVQRAIAIMQAQGLEPTRYGFICHDAWPETPEQVETWEDEYETVEVEAAVTKEHPAIYEQLPVPAPKRGLFRRAPRQFYNQLVKPAWVETIKPAVTEQRLKRAAGRLVVQPHRPAGDRYSFRPDELLLFIARGFEARLSALETKA